MFDQNAFEVRVTEHHRRVSEIEHSAWKLDSEHGEPRMSLTEHFAAAARRASIPAAAVVSGTAVFALLAR
jgi:hypothetical protein